MISLNVNGKNYRGKHLFSCDEIMRRIELPLVVVASNNSPIPH